MLERSIGEGRAVVENPIAFSWTRGDVNTHWENLAWAKDPGPWLFDEPIHSDFAGSSAGSSLAPARSTSNRGRAEDLLYVPKFSGRNVRFSAIHQEFARLDPTEEHFAAFARTFGRLGLSEPFSPPIADEGLLVEGAEHHDTWLDCLNLVRLALAASWYDTGWQVPLGDGHKKPPTPGSPLTRDQSQWLAREWLKSVDEVLEWELKPKGHQRRSLFERVTIKTRRYTFADGSRKFVFDHAGGLKDDSDAYRRALAAALANDAIGSDVRLQVDPSSRTFRFRPVSLWAYLWLELVTQMDAHVDYRWCLHCGVSFVVAEERTRSDRLFCAPECATANYEWRKKEALRLAASGGAVPIEQVITAIYAPEQINSKPKRARAAKTVGKWLTR